MKDDNELTLPVLMEQKKVLDVLIEKKKRELEEEELVARKKLVPKYQLIQVSKFDVNEKGIKELGVGCTYQFHFELVNEEEYDNHLEYYGRLTNKPDDLLQSAKYFWVPVDVGDTKVGVIGHTGGGHLVLRDYVMVTLDEWLNFVTKGKLIVRALTYNTIPNNDINFYI